MKSTMKKNFILSIFAISIAIGAQLFAETVDSHFTKNCICKVMTSSAKTNVTFSLVENESELNVLVSPFSYNDKSIGEFSFVAQKKSDGFFYAQKQSAKTTNASGEEIIVTISSAKIDVQNQKVELKFKPGKMPFNISLQTIN